MLQASSLHNLVPAGARNVPALPLSGSERGDVGNGNGDRVHAEGSEQVLGLGVDLEGVLGRGQSRDVGNVSSSQCQLIFHLPICAAAPRRKVRTHWSFLSRSSSCSRKEIPRTGPFWIRFIKWVVTSVCQLKTHHAEGRHGRGLYRTHSQRSCSSTSWRERTRPHRAIACWCWVRQW